MRLTPLVALTLFLGVRAGAAQGGPPLVTDDPGTPGDRHWEVNLAFTYEKREGERVFRAPLLDANYGLGDRIQLKGEMPWIFVRGEDGGNRENGPGNALFGVKWRFVDEKDGGVSISTYPQIEINVSRSSADRGFVERQPGFLLPLSFSRDFGPVSANLEVGHAFRRGEKSRWIYGLALGHELSDRLEAVCEIFGSASARLDDAGLDWNMGLRWKLGRKLVFLLSAGAGAVGTAEESRAHFQSYSGLQLLF